MNRQNKYLSCLFITLHKLLTHKSIVYDSLSYDFKSLIFIKINSIYSKMLTYLNSNL